MNTSQGKQVPNVVQASYGTYHASHASHESRLYAPHGRQGALDPEQIPWVTHAGLEEASREDLQTDLRIMSGRGTVKAIFKA